MADLSSDEILLQYWLDQRQQARQTEEHRATAAGLVLVLAAAALSYVSQRGLEPSVLPVTIGMAILGAYGAAITLKYYERYQLHLAVAHELTLLLGQSTSAPPLLEIIEKNRRVGAGQRLFGWIGKAHLYQYWIALYAIVCLAGTILTIIAL